MGSEENARELHETVRKLEAALSSSRAEVQQLHETLGSRETEIAGLRQMLTHTKKERDELRGQNAELVNRLAVIGRKQSTSSSPSLPKQLRSTPSSDSLPPTPSTPTTPSSPSSPLTHSPTLQRKPSIKTNSPLPPIPPEITVGTADTPTPDEESDTEYCDMETEDSEKNKTATTERKRRSKSPPAEERHTQQKFSQPKSIIRNVGGGKKAVSSTAIAGEGRGEGRGGGVVKIVSPKKSVAFPLSENLSIISEEGSPENTRVVAAATSDKGGKFEGLAVFVGVAKGEEEKGSGYERRRVTMSMADFKKKSQSEDIPSENEEEGKEEEEGQGKKTVDHLEMRRSRTCTISSSSGGSYKKEYKRKNSKQLKEAAARLERSANFISGGRKFQGRLELFSPDMELRIRDKICSEIGKKYGGLLRASKAAVAIQSAYRQYKLRQRYDKIRKEANQVRKRAQSMKDSRRKPSMIRRNRPSRYNRYISALAPSTDPLLKTKLLSQDIGREGVSHMSSRRQLVEKARSERSVEEDKSVVGRESSGTSESGAMEMETVVCEISIEVEAKPSLPQPNGSIPLQSPASSSTEATDSNLLPTSFSTDVLLTPDGYQRPLSIFSVRPSVSMVDTSLAGQERGRDGVLTLSPEVRHRKLIMGIGHFNKKPTRGIKYLVRESVLPDSPQEVASFMAKQYGLSKEKIGEFVGEINSEFHMAVLECLLEQMDMKNKPIDEALRDFQILFRMPGEAQKIDKIMQIFALEFFRFNKEGLIKSEDAAYILAFAIMMLHTSLHNPSVKNRTTKKQWVSMNRGCNDGDNFAEHFLYEIFDRISKREFTTGQDHTNIVCDIERNLVGYQNSSRLAVPQRRLVCRAGVTAIDQLTSRPSFKNKRRRVLFVFNDLVIICKKRGGDQLDYRGSFSLMDAIAISFETHHYKNGIQLYSSHDAKAMFQCNCDSSDDRVKLLRTLEATISELRELEKERIAELGSSVSAQPAEGEGEGGRRGRMASRAGDLLSSSKLAGKERSIRTRRESKGDYVSGVGDLVISSRATSSTIIRRTSRSSGSSSPHNRTSGESGYDSQRTTPVPSPSPTNPPHSTPHNSHSSPFTKRALQSRESTASAPMTLVTPANPVKRSKSTDQIHLVRVMTITPTLSRDAKNTFSSVEDLRGGAGSGGSGSPRTSKKKKENSRKSEKKRLSFSPFRRHGKRGSAPGSGGNSPVSSRSRAASETPSPPPPPLHPSDLEHSSSAFGRSGSYLVNTT